MTARPELPEGTFAAWLVVGGSMVGIWGLLGYSSADPDSWARGIVVAVPGAGLALMAFARWRRRLGIASVPMGEYLALVWLGLYGVLALAHEIGGERWSPTDWLLLLPPVSVAPAAARVLLVDDGDPAGRARFVAGRLHTLAGLFLVGWSVLFVLSGLLFYLSPLPFVPGVLHLHAGSEYAGRRPLRSEPLKPRFDPHGRPI